MAHDAMSRPLPPEPNAIYDSLAPFYEPSGLGEYAERFTEELEALLRDSPPPGGPWLDLGCGTGILLAGGLAGRSLAVGLDLSLGMLAIARRRHGPLMQADVRRLPLSNASIALATATFDVANHVAPALQLECFLREVKRVLRPGGLFVFDLNTPDHLRLWHGVDEHTPLDDGSLLRRARFDDQRGILSVEMIHESGTGRAETLGTLTETAYPPALVRGFLKRAGFHPVERRVGRRTRGYDLRDLWIARCGTETLDE